MDDPRTHLLRDELTEHDRFVVALARRLLRDPDDARDAAQDAWTVALARSRPEHIPLRMWLAGIVKNLARNRRRDLARRERLDARIPIPERPVTADALVQKTEMEGRILRAVLALDEPIRACVLMRFREGMSSKEIASHLRIPAGTARWRVHKGIEQVRVQLDNDHGGDRDAWLPGVAVMARYQEMGLAAAMLGGVGGVAMKWKLSLLVAVLVALSAALIQRESGDNAGVPSVAALNPTPPDREEAGDAEGVAREVLWNAPEVAEEAVTLRVRGRCIGPGGDPLEGVLVELVDSAWVSNSAAQRDAPVAIAVPAPAPAPGSNQAFTSTNGRFEVVRSVVANADSSQAESTGNPTRVARSAPVVRFSRTDAVARSLSSFGMDRDDGDGVDFGDVVLQPGSWVSGRVQDEEGRPIAAARVRASRDISLTAFWRTSKLYERDSVFTDDEGRFVLRGIRPSWIRVRAAANGFFGGASEPIGLLAGRPAIDIVVTLPRTDGHLITGIALDAGGKPLAHVDISHHESHRRELTGSTRIGRLRTDAEGRFSIRAFDGISHFLRLQKDGAVTDSGTLVAGEHHVILQLPEVREMTLEIRDRLTGLPPSSASEVRVMDPDDHGYSARYELPANTPRLDVPVLDQTFMVRVAAPGFLGFDSDPHDPSRVGRTPLRLELERAQRIGGAVSHAGSPLPGATVSVMFSGETMYFGFPCRAVLRPEPAYSVTTDAGGRFAIPSPYRVVPVIDNDPEIYVRADAPGFGARWLGPKRASAFAAEESLRLDLSPGGRVEGTVVGQDNKPVAGRLVAASNADGVPRFTSTDSEGRYALDHLSPGPWQIEVRSSDDPKVNQRSLFYRPDGMRFPSNCQVIEGQTTRCDLAVRPGARCTVRGTIAAGRVRPGLYVNLFECSDISEWSVAISELTRGDRDRDRVLGRQLANTPVLPDGSYEVDTDSSGTAVLVLTVDPIDTAGGLFGRCEIEALVDLTPGHITMDFNQPIGVVQGPGFDSRTEASRNRPSQIEWVAELSPRIRAHGRCTTDAYGSFLLDFVPAGRIFVHIGDDWVPLEVVAGKKTFLK